MGQKDTKGEKKGNNENEKNSTPTSTRRAKKRPTKQTLLQHTDLQMNKRF